MLVGGQHALERRVVAPFGKDGGNVFVHRETKSLFVIVPDQVDTRVERAGPVLGGGAVLEEGVAKVWAWQSPTYLMPKSSTMSVNMIVRHLGCKRPGVQVHW